MDCLKKQENNLLSPQYVLFNIESNAKTHQGEILQNQHPFIDGSWAGLQDFSHFTKTKKNKQKNLLLPLI